MTKSADTRSSLMLAVAAATTAVVSWLSQQYLHVYNMFSHTNTRYDPVSYCFESFSYEKFQCIENLKFTQTYVQVMTQPCRKLRASRLKCAYWKAQCLKFQLELQQAHSSSDQQECNRTCTGKRPSIHTSRSDGPQTLSSPTATPSTSKAKSAAAEVAAAAATATVADDASVCISVAATECDMIMSGAAVLRPPAQVSNGEFSASLGLHVTQTVCSTPCPPSSPLEPGSVQTVSGCLHTESNASVHQPQNTAAAALEAAAAAAEAIEKINQQQVQRSRLHASAEPSVPPDFP